MEPMTVLPWLKALLSITTFFSECPTHTKQFKRECNMFCFDCSDNKALCFNCIQSCHKDHRSIQIRKSSYHNVVRTEDIENYLDITGIQTYVINSFKIVFLNKRKSDKPKTNRAGKSCKRTSECEACGRNISNSARFCSLGCKFAWIMKSESRNVSTDLSTNKAEETKETEEVESTNRLPSQKQAMSNLGKRKATPEASSNSRKRKGIPCRAPFY